MPFSRRTPLYITRQFNWVHANVNIAIKPPLAMIADDMSSFQYGQTNWIQFQAFHRGWHLPSHRAAQ